MSQPVFVISGAPSSGKTSVARAILQHFPLGLHLPLDTFREFVVSGRASIYNWNDETTRQFSLARCSATAMAARYLGAGFAVAIDDVIFPHEAESLFAELEAEHKVYKVLLRPNLETTLARNASRTTKTFDTAALVDMIQTVKKRLDEREAAFANGDWLMLESSSMTLEETVSTILDFAGLKFISSAR